MTSNQADKDITADLLKVAEVFVAETKEKCKNFGVMGDDENNTLLLAYYAFLYGAKNALTKFGFNLDQEMLTKNKKKLFPQDAHK